MKSINVFKEENLFWLIFKNLIGSFLLAICITLVVSLLFGYQYKIVASGSMTPTLKVRTIVVVAPIKYEDIKVGDIVTYSSGNTTGIVYNFTHRVVRISENGKIVTAGDANIQEDGKPREDGEISEERIVGKVLFDMYPVGLLVTYLQGHILQVALMILIVFLTYLVIS